MKLEFRKARFALVGVLVACGAAAACANSDDDLAGDPNAGPDAGVDRDAGKDAASSDVTEDGGKDAGKDSAKDAGQDADEPDAGLDASVDAGPDAAHCSAGGWCHTDNTLFAQETLRGIWAGANGVAFTVSESGKAYVYSGGKWHLLFTEPSATPAPFYAVWGSSNTDVWIGGKTGLFHGTGTSPEQLTFAAVPINDRTDLPNNQIVVSLWGSGPNDIYAVTNNGTGRTGGTWDVAARPTGSSSYVLRYKGAPADPADMTRGWVKDEFFGTAVESTFLNRVFGSSATDVWVVGSRTIGTGTAAKQRFLAVHYAPDATNNGALTPTLTLPVASGAPTDPSSVSAYNGGSMWGGASVDSSKALVFGKYGYSTGVPGTGNNVFAAVLTAAATPGAYQVATLNNPQVGDSCSVIRDWYGAEAVGNDVYYYGGNNSTSPHTSIICRYVGTKATNPLFEIEDFELEDPVTQEPITVPILWGSAKSSTAVWIVGEGTAMYKQLTPPAP